MPEKSNIEELIAESITRLLVRSQQLPRRDKLAISQEFREWLDGSCKTEDILILDTRIT
tara:strand:- start:163 stop:339 length:177 start_codon:yes stop_codon:yes gene_type:complete